MLAVYVRHFSKSFLTPFFKLVEKVPSVGNFLKEISTQTTNFSTIAIKGVSQSQIYRQLPQKHYSTFEGGYNRYKKEEEPVAHGISLSMLKNAIYGAFATGVLYFSKEYFDVEKEIKYITLEIDNQAKENTLALEKVHILNSQSFLHLTANSTEIDKRRYDQDKAELEERVRKLEGFEKKLESLPFQITFRRFLENLRSRLEREIGQLEIVSIFNETIWLQKNGQYLTAFSKNKDVIAKLEEYLKKWETTVVHLPRILAAAYSIQAKLEACLAFSSVSTEDREDYREASLKSYNYAIDLLEKNKGTQVELAILLSGKGYVLVDCGEPAEAWLVQQQANSLKPNDEYILCGMGLALHQLEKQKKSDGKLEAAKLDSAYEYFTLALQLNNKVPNIYVLRGKLLLELGDTQRALVDFESALSLDKNHWQAHLEKALILLEQNNCDIAEKYIKESLLQFVDQSDELNKQIKQIHTSAKKMSTCQPLKESVFFKFESNKMSDENDKLKLGIYRHYKGQLYEVLGIAKHTETLDTLVVYRAMYNSKEFGNNALWVRPLDLFLENIDVSGKKKPRFELISEIHECRLKNKK